MLLLSAFSACEKSDLNENKIFCENYKYKNYLINLNEDFSSFVENCEKDIIIEKFNEKSTIEAFDKFALNAVNYGISNYWYPQYTATAVIAVDRDRINANINGWLDLSTEKNDFSVFIDPSNRDSLIAAFSYGLEGEIFTYDSALKIFRSLYLEGKLSYDINNADIIVCFDYQAVSMMQNGRNLEIIIPAEGTLTYVKGLLSNNRIDLKTDENLLIKTGLRTLNGDADLRFYPPAAEYERAVILKDYTHLNNISNSLVAVWRREVLHLRLYSSANGQEHQAVALVYMILIIIWIGSIFYRTMQKGVRLSVLVTGILLVGWILIRIIKYQHIGSDLINIYLWYSFYIFQLCIPISILWLAFLIDKSENTKRPPTILFWLAGLNVLLILTVLTNNLHNYVFIFDKYSDNWNENYEYGIVFYVIDRKSVV